MTSTRHLSSNNNLQSSSSDKVALVIGNSQYEKGPLINPANDSEDIANLLEKIGFDVKLLQDASLRKMAKAVDEFGSKLSKQGAGLFYYAGHGVQVKGVNYLIPIDAHIEQELQVEFEALDVFRVLRWMEESRNGVNIIILDACRNNPYERSFRSGSGRGLASIQATEGTIIAYSTAPGKVAEDGNSRNSPFTEELLKYIQVPGLPIESILKQVRRSVREKTSEYQKPRYENALDGDFYFIPPLADKTSSHLSLNEGARIIYRNKSERLTETHAKAMIEKHGFFELNWNKLATGIKHDYHLLQEGEIVYDKTTNLMWQQSGSDQRMPYNDAEVFIAKLNQEKDGSYTDWRLPTLEEAMSLMKRHIDDKGDLHIHPIFDKKQRFIWTADYASADMVWCIHFVDGLCIRNQMNSNYFVRAVRNGQ